VLFEILQRPPCDCCCGKALVEMEKGA